MSSSCTGDWTNSLKASAASPSQECGLGSSHCHPQCHMAWPTGLTRLELKLSPFLSLKAQCILSCLSASQPGLPWPGSASASQVPNQAFGRSVIMASCSHQGPHQGWRREWGSVRTLVPSSHLGVSATSFSECPQGVQDSGSHGSGLWSLVQIQF